MRYTRGFRQSFVRATELRVKSRPRSNRWDKRITGSTIWGIMVPVPLPYFLTHFYFPNSPTPKQSHCGSVAPYASSTLGMVLLILPQWESRAFYKIKVFMQQRIDAAGNLLPLNSGRGFGRAIICATVDTPHLSIIKKNKTAVTTDSASKGALVRL